MTHSAKPFHFLRERTDIYNCIDISNPRNVLAARYEHNVHDASADLAL